MAATDVFSKILVDQSNSWYALGTLIVPLLYWLYYRKYRHYIFQQKNEVKTCNKPRGSLIFLKLLRRTSLLNFV